MELELPSDVKVDYADARLSVQGTRGTLSRVIPSDIVMKVDGATLHLESKNTALLHTYRSHIRNMLKGVREGYETKLKAIYAHFPITVEAKGTDIIIKNFLGEKQPRRARLFPPTTLQAKGNEVVLKGPDKEALGLTIASIRRATYIRHKDPRVFQDGFYIIEQT
jgi:large subunit ribosomal protein L6